MDMLSTTLPSVTPEQLYGFATPQADLIDARVAEDLAPLRQAFSERQQLAEVSHEHPQFRDALDTWVNREILEAGVVPEDTETALQMRIDALSTLIAELKEDKEDKHLIEIAKKERDICKRYRDDQKLGRLSVVDTVHVADDSTGFYL